RRAIRTNSPLAQYARACGRVSVGGDLDKRPVNRPSKARQPEANRRTPPNGGRDLKQRRTGLFWSLLALQRSAPKEACLSCRACGRDIFSSKRWLCSLEAAQPQARLGHGVAADRSSGPSMAFLSPSSDSRSGRVGGSTTAR